MNDKPVRVVLVDDHEVVRAGLTAVVAPMLGRIVVGEGGSVAEALQDACDQSQDVMIMAVRLLDGTAIEACRAIREELPETRVLILTSFGEDEAVLAAILAGASGFLLKDAGAKSLVEAIDTIGRGGSLLDPGVTQGVMDRVRRV